MTGSSTYAILPLVATGMSLVLAPLAWRRRPAPGVNAFVAMLMCSAVWSGLQAAQVLASDPQLALLAAKFQMIGIAGSPVFLLLFVLDYTRGVNRPLRSRISLGLFAVPGIVVGLTFTNELHGLVWSSTDFVRGLPVIVERNTGFFFHTAYSHGIALVAFGGGLWHVIEHPSQPARTISILSGPIFVLVINALHLSGLFPTPIDPTPTAFTLGLTVGAVSIFRYHLFDVTPVARSRLLQEMGDAVIAIDVGGRIVDLNSAAKDLGRASLDDGFGAPASEWLPEPVVAFLESGLNRGEIEIESDPARVLDGAICAMGRSEDSRGGRLLVLRDVSERRRGEMELQRTRAALEEANAHLTRLAATDELTGLASRRHFLDRVESELARANRHGNRFGLLMIDIDHFKEVNDAHGHLAGDQVLKAVAETLEEQVRASDLAGRIGGEEFAVVVCESDLAGCEHLAELIRGGIEHLEVTLNLVPIHVTVSVGATALRDGDTDARDLLSRADAALYSAKSAGRNCVRSSPRA